MKKILALVFVIGVFSSANAQANLTKTEVEQLTELKEHLSGTYQIQMVDTRSKPAIPLFAFREIDQRRQQSEMVYYQLNPRTRIKIFSQEEIDNPSFVAPEPIVFIKSEN